MPIEFEPPPPSRGLLSELADGSASPLVKAAVSIALIPLFMGIAFLASFVIAGFVPSWSRGGRGPEDELLACTFVVSSLFYVGSVAWLWTRDRRKHSALWIAGAVTFGIVLTTVVLCVLIDGMLRHGGEVLIFAVMSFGAAAVVLTWVQAARQYARFIPLTHADDGALGVRCPACDYRMVGLHESRCPECGTEYTIDGLLAQQQFLTRAHRKHGHIPPPPPPVPDAEQSAVQAIAPAQ